MMHTCLHGWSTKYNGIVFEAGRHRYCTGRIQTALVMIILLQQTHAYESEVFMPLDSSRGNKNNPDFSNG